MVVIPFSLPKVGPTNLEEIKSFQSLKKLRRAAGSSIAWCISLGHIFTSTAKDVIGGSLLPKVHLSLRGMDPRMITGYAVLLFFAKQVS